MNHNSNIANNSKPSFIAPNLPKNIISMVCIF